MLFAARDNPCYASVRTAALRDESGGNMATAPMTINEQLPLFSLGPLPESPPSCDRALPDGLSPRARLSLLLAGDLDFHGTSGIYASHDLHAFAAKFPPQLPGAFIRGLTRPGDTVLDPMMGSGTAVVEAQVAGRRGVGLDLDPLALRISQAKTTVLDPARVAATGTQVVARARQLLADEPALADAMARRFDVKTRAFIDYWFFPHTQRELMALVLAIEEVGNAALRRFLELAFSAIIVTKSGGVSRARDLAHSRPHLVADKTPKPAIDQFALRLKKNIASIGRLADAGGGGVPLAGDARAMPLASGTVDLIVTSPPYANAIDYMRAHKFSLVWLGRSVAELSALRAQYVGAERTRADEQTPLPARTEGIVTRLAALDPGKARVLRKYYGEMGAVLAEMFRVLRPDACAVMVVGTSTMRGLDVRTHDCLAELAAAVGFDVVGVMRRALDRDKRMMPARFGKRGDSTIEQRMHEEYVIGLLKPAP